VYRDFGLEHRREDRHSVKQSVRDRRRTSSATNHCIGCRARHESCSRPKHRHELFCSQSRVKRHASSRAHHKTSDAHNRKVGQTPRNSGGNIVHQAASLLRKSLRDDRGAVHSIPSGQVRVTYNHNVCEPARLAACRRQCLLSSTPYRRWHPAVR